MGREGGEEHTHVLEALADLRHGRDLQIVHDVRRDVAAHPQPLLAVVLRHVHRLFHRRRCRPVHNTTPHALSRGSRPQPQPRRSLVRFRVWLFSHVLAGLATLVSRRGDTTRVHPRVSPRAPHAVLISAASIHLTSYDPGHASEHWDAQHTHTHPPRSHHRRASCPPRSPDPTPVVNHSASAPPGCSQAPECHRTACTWPLMYTHRSSCPHVRSIGDRAACRPHWYLPCPPHPSWACCDRPASWW